MVNLSVVNAHLSGPYSKYCLVNANVEVVHANPSGP
jgi:hypothetical protein